MIRFTYRVTARASGAGLVTGSGRIESGDFREIVADVMKRAGVTVYTAPAESPCDWPESVFMRDGRPVFVSISPAAEDFRPGRPAVDVGPRSC